MAPFVRSLVGLERDAVQEVLGAFLQGRVLTANQQEFVAMLIEHLTEHGVMDAVRLYESPFIDLAPSGPEGLFGQEGADVLVAVIERSLQAAAA